MRSSIEKHDHETHDSIDSGWRQLEEFIEGLHLAARSESSPIEFYRKLLDGCVSTLAASSGAVWVSRGPETWEVLHQVNLASALDRDDPQAWAEHHSLVAQMATSTQARVLPPRSGTLEASGNPTDSVLLLCSVDELSLEETDTIAPGSSKGPHAVVELFLRSGSSPEVQEGWCELLATVCRVAAEFHTFGELRSLRGQSHTFHQALAVLRQVDASTDMQHTAMTIANEGRRLVESDRLSLLLRHGKSWRLVAVSGVDRIERRADTTKSLQSLAKAVAKWGEPVSHDGAGEETDRADGETITDEIPEQLSLVLQQHMDQSQARELNAVPIEFQESDQEAESSRRKRVLPQALLVSEQFEAAEANFAQQRVIELAQLCEPALRRATRLDRFPIRTALRWAEHWSWLRVTAKLSQYVLALGITAAMVFALLVTPCDFVVEAPATLVPLVERDVFASASGTVAEVRVAHGQQVAEGEVLAVLHDPLLSLDQQRLAGEIETASKRLEAIAVARTDRDVQQNRSQNQLPLSAEVQQLEKRLTNLMLQREILQARREALTLRSPTSGQVLTLDVQQMLRTRPVERGQVLFTVADTTSGWRIDADVPQDRLGRILAAQQKSGVELPVHFRLSGDVHQTYAGHVEEVPPTAVLDTDSLVEEAPPVRVRVCVDQQSLKAARPGMTARVRIVCGQRSLGYVWLHDIWETVYSWWVFS